MESNESRNSYSCGESNGESCVSHIPTVCTYSYNNGESYGPTVSTPRSLELEKKIVELQEQLKLQRQLDELDNRRNILLKKMEKYGK